MDIKVCGHKCLRILRSRSIAISKEITINERLVECTKCTVQRSEYEITNYDLKNFQNEILANLPPKYINESLEERAERLYENQEYVDAVKAYESLIELEEKIINGKKNKKTQWFLRLAEINAKLGKYKKSLKILDDLNIPIKDKQSKYREFCIRIFLNYELKNYENLFVYFSKILNLSPESGLYFQRGGIKYELNDLQGAFDDYTKAIELDPVDLDIYIKRYQVRWKLKDYIGVIEDCRYISSNFDLEKPVIEALDKKREEAIQKLFDINPNSEQALIAFADYKYEVNYDDYGAIAELTRAINLNPNNADLYTKRGRCKFTLNDDIGAIADLSQAIVLNPNYEAYYLRGQAYHSMCSKNSHLNEWEKAIADFTSAILLNPLNEEIYICRGFSNFRLDDFEGAIMDFTIAIEINSNCERAYIFRGLMKRCQENYEEAILDYESAIEINPNSDSGYLNIGRVLFDINDEKNAIKACSKAIKINPKNSDAYIYRGDARYNERNYKEAFKDYKKALKLDPYNQNLRKKLDDLKFER